MGDLTGVGANALASHFLLQAGCKDSREPPFLDTKILCVTDCSFSANSTRCSNVPQEEGRPVFFFGVAAMSTWPILPVLVFVAEICVVTLSTIRIIFLSRGMQVAAATLGFFEVSIWLFAIGQIMQNLDNIGCYLAFAGGFTLGNYLAC